MSTDVQQEDPARRSALPAAFHRMWTAAGVSFLGDGVYLAALPLLAASLTRDPVVLSLVTAAALLPWLLFGLVGGALVDRWDHRRTMFVADTTRAGLLALAVLASLFDVLRMPLLIVVAFLLGIGQLLFDIAAQSYLPQLLDRDATLLQRANARLRGTQTATEGMIGPPVGSALFALGRAVPFAVDAASFLFSALLVRTLPPSPPKVRTEQTSLWADIRAGTSYLLGHRLLLGLALRPAVGNTAFMAGEAVLVLYAQERLNLSSSGYGLLLATQAVGGVLGAAVAGRLGTWFGIGTALTITAAIEAAAQLGLGLAANPWLAGVALAISGAAMTATMVLGPSIRQAIVPDELMGRVSAASRLIAVSGGPLGAVIGGLLARFAGLQAPFVFGAVLLAVMTVLAATLTSNSRIEAALAEAKAASGRA